MKTPDRTQARTATGTWLTFGAGVLSGGAVGLWNFLSEEGSLALGFPHWWRNQGLLHLLIAGAGGLAMLACLTLWRRLRWRPAGWAGWLALGLLASVSGALLTGLLVGLSIGALTGSFTAPLLGAVFGLRMGVASGAAPLGGLLFVWLARRA